MTLANTFASSPEFRNIFQRHQMDVLFDRIESLHFENDDGFELNPVGNDRKHNLSCIICLEIPFRPFQFDCCGGIICDLCRNTIERSRINGIVNPCPNCRSRSRTFHDTTDKTIVKQILGLQTQCVLKCGWTGVTRDQCNHIETECQLANVKCKRCSEVVTFTKYERHIQEDCKFVTCQHCFVVTSLHEWTEHECDMKTIECESGCGVRMQKWFRTIHLSYCLEAMVPCHLFVRCRYILERRFLEDHFKSCVVKYHSDVCKILAGKDRRRQDVFVGFDSTTDVNKSVPFHIFDGTHVQLFVPKSKTNRFLHLKLLLLKGNTTKSIQTIMRLYSLTVTLFNRVVDDNHLTKKLHLSRSFDDELGHETHKRNQVWLVCDRFISNEHLCLNAVTQTDFLDGSDRNRMKFRLEFNRV